MFNKVKSSIKKLLVLIFYVFPLLVAVFLMVRHPLDGILNEIVALIMAVLNLLMIVFMHNVKKNMQNK